AEAEQRSCCDVNRVLFLTAVAREMMERACPPGRSRARGDGGTTVVTMAPHWRHHRRRSRQPMLTAPSVDRLGLLSRRSLLVPSVPWASGIDVGLWYGVRYSA